MNALIIGGTSGLGLEIAKEFSEPGDDVYVTGRRELDIVCFDDTYVQAKQEGRDYPVKFGRDRVVDFK